MTVEEFRKLALGLPDTSESSHMGHPDFRVAKRVFATLGYPAAGWAMIKLPAVEQAERVRTHPEVFVPAKGAWGRGGATCVWLKDAPRKLVRDALVSACSSTADGRRSSEVRPTRKAASATTRSAQRKKKP